jgi:hypothetical protein
MAAEPFGCIPEGLLLDSNVTSDAKVLYAVLSRYANRVGECWPGQETLAARLGWSDRRVRRHLAELVTAGALKAMRRGRRVTNVYRLAVLGDRTLASAHGAGLPDAGVLSDRTLASAPSENESQENESQPAARARETEITTEELHDGAFAQTWNAHRGDLRPVWQPKRRDQAARMRALVAGADGDLALLGRAVALFAENRRGQHDPPGWPVFEADAAGWLRRARERTAEDRRASRPPEEPASIREAREREQWEREHPEEAEQERERARRTARAISLHGFTGWAKLSEAEREAAIAEPEPVAVAGR